MCARHGCPCGHAGDPAAACTCLPDAVERYHARLSGPLMDRIDLRVHVPRLAYDELRSDGRYIRTCWRQGAIPSAPMTTADVLNGLLVDVLAGYDQSVLCTDS